MFSRPRHVERENESLWRLVGAGVTPPRSVRPCVVCLSSRRQTRNNARVNKAIFTITPLHVELFPACTEDLVGTRGLCTSWCVRCPRVFVCVSCYRPRHSNRWADKAVRDVVEATGLEACCACGAAVPAGVRRRCTGAFRRFWAADGRTGDFPVDLGEDGVDAATGRVAHVCTGCYVRFHRWQQRQAKAAADATPAVRDRLVRADAATALSPSHAHTTH